MKIDVYQSTKNRSRFLSVPHGCDVSKLNISPQEAEPYRQVLPFEKGLTIEAGDARIAMNSDNILQQISSKGYALHGVRFDFGDIT